MNLLKVVTARADRQHLAAALDLIAEVAGHAEQIARLTGEIARQLRPVIAREGN